MLKNAPFRFIPAFSDRRDHADQIALGFCQIEKGLPVGRAVDIEWQGIVPNYAEAPDFVEVDGWAIDRLSLKGGEESFSAGHGILGWNACGKRIIE